MQRLQEFLKLRLCVLRKAFGAHVSCSLNRFIHPQNHALRRFKTGVQKNGAEHSFAGVGQNRRTGRAARFALSFPKPDKFPDFDFGRYFVQRLFADEIRTGAGEHSFGVVRVPQKQGVPHHTIQNGVTQKLQTFIVFGRETAVRHGARQERLILKVIVDPFFQNRQIHQTLSGHTVT